MSVTDLGATLDSGATGEEMLRLMAELYPICRSITGQGFRESLTLLERHVPLAVREVPSGTRVFDWTVPKEWNIRDAYVKNSRGERVIDFQKSNLHVVNYSVPVRQRMSLAELRPHLFSLPDHPDWIPYRTSYYKETWGFCVSHRQLLAMADDEYEVVIDSSLADGHLTYAERYLPGESPDEVMFSSHACHPSLCNDNLAGVVVAAFLARALAARRLRYSYRFLFIPGTIGAITWLALNEARVGRIKHGLVLSCLGDPGSLTYKRSRQGHAEIDRAVGHVLKQAGGPYEIMDFSPYGYDERQYCSPGFDLPVGCLMRTPHGRYPEYHTSADDLTLMTPSALGSSLATCLAVVALLEGNRAYLNQNPKCEPQLGRRGLYRLMGGEAEEKVDETAILWVLNQSDGEHTLLDIAERSGLGFTAIVRAAEALLRQGLLKESV